MNKKIKKILILLLLIILTMFIIITYKYYKLNLNLKKSDVILLNTSQRKKELYDENYYAKYKKYIIEESKINIPYYLYINEEYVSGNIILGSDKKLYFVDYQSNVMVLLIDEIIKTNYYNNEPIKSVFEFYSITESGNLYKISIYGKTKSDFVVKKIQTSEKIINFVDLKVSTLYDDIAGGIVVLGESGKMYHAESMVEYNPNMINVFNQYILYENGIITTFDNNYLSIDEKNINVIKIIVSNEEKINLPGSPTILVLSSDYYLMYLNENDEYVKYKKKVTNIVNKDEKIHITFDDKTEISFKYFSINDF